MPPAGKHRDADTAQVLVFLTNHMGFAASKIARIYNDCRQITPRDLGQQ